MPVTHIYLHGRLPARSRDEDDLPKLRARLREIENGGGGDKPVARELRQKIARLAREQTVSNKVSKFTESRDAETKHDPKNGQFSSGGSSGGSSHTKVSRNELRSKIQGKTKEQLYAALNHKDTHPSVKKEIERELDDRANRGS